MVERKGLPKNVARRQQTHVENHSISFVGKNGRGMENWAGIRAIGVEFAAVIAGIFLAALVLWVH
jgi:hypothetical protein